MKGGCLLMYFSSRFYQDKTAYYFKQDSCTVKLAAGSWFTNGKIPVILDNTHQFCSEFKWYALYHCDLCAYASCPLSA